MSNRTIVFTHSSSLDKGFMEYCFVIYKVSCPKGAYSHIQRLVSVCDVLEIVTFSSFPLLSERCASLYNDQRSLSYICIIFVLCLYYICIILLLSLYYACIMFILYLSYIFILFVLYLYYTCVIFGLYLYYTSWDF